MKTLAVIYVTLISVIIGGILFVDSTINARVDGLKAVTSTEMQPFGKSYEDELTATQVVQPADYSKQTTRHYEFLQGSSPVLQSGKVTLQGE